MGCSERTISGSLCAGSKAGSSHDYLWGRRKCHVSIIAIGAAGWGCLGLGQSTALGCLSPPPWAEGSKLSQA